MFAEAPRLLPEPGSEPGADRKPRPGLPGCGGSRRGAGRADGVGDGDGDARATAAPLPVATPSPTARSAGASCRTQGSRRWRHLRGVLSPPPGAAGPRPRGRTASREPDADERAVQRRLPRRRERLGAQRGRARGKGLPDRTALGTDGLSVSRRRLHRGSLHFVFVPFCVEYVLPYLWCSS